MNKYKVWEEQVDPIEYSMIQAYYPEEAAETWAEQDDWSSAEYSICGKGHEPIVCVKDCKTNIIKKFQVSGECVPQYSAVEINES